MSSGKTTALVARIAWRIAEGVSPARMCAVVFNARAAEELRERIAPIGPGAGADPDAVRVRTFHALDVKPRA